MTISRRERCRGTPGQCYRLRLDLDQVGIFAFRKSETFVDPSRAASPIAEALRVGLPVLDNAPMTDPVSSDPVVADSSGRFVSGWREHLAIRLIELNARNRELEDSSFKSLAQNFLDRATTAVQRRATPLGAWSGSDLERAWVSTHAAEVAMIRGSSPDDVLARLPSLVEECAALIPKDPRVDTLRKLAGAATAITPIEQSRVADTLASAHGATDAQHVRVRSFRNVLVGTTGVLSLLALIVGWVAFCVPGAFAVCDAVVAAKGAAGAVATSCPTGSQNPSGGDVFAVELLGLLAAAITGAVAIRKMSGTSTPYAVPLASLVLKLPIGALTALGGLLLLRAGFAGSITKLNQAQVSAYALVFGAAQQLFMQFVDKQAKTVLDATTTPGDTTKPTGK